MSLRRIVGGAVAVAAAAGFLTAGVAAATDGPHPPPPASSSCSAPTEGTASNSPGVNSGNVIQVPIGNCGGPLVYAPVNVCGNSVNAPGMLNPSFGNTCSNQ